MLLISKAFGPVSIFAGDNLLVRMRSPVEGEHLLNQQVVTLTKIS